MQPCDCQHRAAYFALHEDDIDAFVSGFDRLTHDRKVYQLFRCPACRTLWIVDDQSRGPMAVRARTEADINSFDERPYRRELVIKSHGGLSETKCMFIDCNNRALNGIVFCVDHQYPDYAFGEPRSG